MNNTYKLDTKIGNIISIKKVIVAVIGKKDIDYLTLGYLNQNNEFDNIVIENNCDKEAIFSVGDFLVYDDENLYKLERDKLISLNNYDNFTIDKNAIEILKEAGYTLYKEITNHHSKNHISMKIKRLISN